MQTLTVNPIAGNRFGMLVVVSKLGRKCECLCDCGSSTTVTLGNLVSGNTKSCGCYRRTRKLNPKTISERLYEKIEKLPGNGCWLWTGCRTTAGYGHMRISGQNKYIYSHRASWIVHFGELADDIQVCHRCDNPPCVRPDHLFLGTAHDNTLDACIKGRHYTKLTPAEVSEIRRRYRLLPEFNGKKVRGSVTALANDLGLRVSTSLIRMVGSGIGWSHIKDGEVSDEHR